MNVLNLNISVQKNICIPIYKMLCFWSNKAPPDKNSIVLRFSIKMLILFHNQNVWNQIQVWRHYFFQGTIIHVLYIIWKKNMVKFNSNKFKPFCSFFWIVCYSQHIRMILVIFLPKFYHNDKKKEWLIPSVPNYS